MTVGLFVFLKGIKKDKINGIIISFFKKNSQNYFFLPSIFILVTYAGTHLTFYSRIGG